MALNKKVTLQNGISYNYHRISQLKLDVDEDSNGNTIRTLHLEVFGYVSNKYRESGVDNYVACKDYAFRIDEVDAESNLRSVGYNLLKLMNEFEGATDC